MKRNYLLKSESFYDGMMCLPIEKSRLYGVFSKGLKENRLKAFKWEHKKAYLVHIA